VAGGRCVAGAAAAKHRACRRRGAACKGLAGCCYVSQQNVVGQRANNSMTVAIIWQALVCGSMVHDTLLSISGWFPFTETKRFTTANFLRGNRA